MSSLQYYERVEKIIESIAVGKELQNCLRSELKKAFENPKSFYDENGEYLSSHRGMDYSTFGNLTSKMLLIDKMIEAGQMAEIDWREGEEEIRFWINRILRNKQYSFQIQEDSICEDQTGDAVINLINDNDLEPNGFAIETLNIDSDSIPFYGGSCRKAT